MKVNLGPNKLIRIEIDQDLQKDIESLLNKCFKFNIKECKFSQITEYYHHLIL